MFTIKSIAILIFLVIAPLILLFASLLGMYRVLFQAFSIILSKRKRQAAGLTNFKAFVGFAFDSLMPFVSALLSLCLIFLFAPLPIKTIGETAAFNRLGLTQCERVKATQVWEKEGVLRMFNVMGAKRACKED